MKFVGLTQRLLLIAGLLLTGIYVAAYIHRVVVSRTELRRFDLMRGETPGATTEHLVLESGFKVDSSLWSARRISAYEQSLAKHFAPPLAILCIVKVHLEVPVLEGTDDLTLNRGVGHIAGTGPPGGDGNVGIAGHRDGFFRVLKDVGPGDAIELRTLQKTDRYRVDQIMLVRPDDVSVLRPRSTRSLTLVTCYPFHFIGSAPRRYIVQASITDSDRAGTGSISETRLQMSEH
jgi:sortase A